MFKDFLSLCPSVVTLNYSFIPFYVRNKMQFLYVKLMQLLCSIWVNMKSDCNHTQNRMEQLALPAQSCVAPRNPENAISEASRKKCKT